MSVEPATPDPDELMTLDEAAAELGVEPDQARAMVEDDLLVPADEDGELRFSRAAVEAVRLAGG